MMAATMVRTQIQLTEEQDERLERLASVERVSKAELVRRAVDLLLRQRSKAPTKAERVQRLLSIVGAYRSDGLPVAEEHDRYLADAYRADRADGR